MYYLIESRIHLIQQKPKVNPVDLKICFNEIKLQNQVDITKIK